MSLADDSATDRLETGSRAIPSGTSAQAQSPTDKATISTSAEGSHLGAGLAAISTDSHAPVQMTTRTINWVTDEGQGVHTVTRLITQTAVIDDPSASSTHAQVSSAPSEVAEEVKAQSVASGSTGEPSSSFPTAQSASGADPTSSTIISSGAPLQPGAIATSLPSNGNANQVTTFTLASISNRPSGQGSNSPPPLVTMSTATNNRAAANASQSAENIFVPGHQLFPLGITVIVLGSLFVLIALGILLVRIFGWNKKRRLRLSVASFIGILPDEADYGPKGNPMFNPRLDDPASTNQHIASTDPFNQPVDRSDIRVAGAGYAGVGWYDEKAYGYNAYSTDVIPRHLGPVDFARTQTPPPARPPRPEDPRANHSYANPFANPPRKNSHLDVPTDVDMGSPVPSFNTGRMGYNNASLAPFATNPDRPTPTATPTPVGRQQGRSLTHQSRDSGSSQGSGHLIRFGPAPSPNGFVPSRRENRLSNGSMGSVDGGSSTYSSSSAGTDRIIWVTKPLRPAYTAQYGSGST